MGTKNKSKPATRVSGDKNTLPETTNRPDTASINSPIKNGTVAICTSNVDTKDVQQPGKFVGYRTIILRVPLYTREYHLKPASVRQRNTSRIPTKPIISRNDDNLTMQPDHRPVTMQTASGVSSVKRKRYLFPIAAFLLLISGIYYLPRPWMSTACDINTIQNKDFNSFYGISSDKNHFTTQTLSHCNSNIIFETILPQTVLKSDNSPSSFMILSKYGTGKTTLRCLYSNSLSSRYYFKVLLLNKQINPYLQRYISDTSTTNEQKHDSLSNLIGWSQNEFAQLLLSNLVTQFIDTYDKEEYNVPSISLDEKIDLITIICYYYNEQETIKLEHFVNAFLFKTDDNIYTADKAQGQILQRNVYQDKPLLLQLKRDLKKLSILSTDDRKLELLLSIIEGEGFQHTAIEKTVSDDIFSSLTHFTQFMKNDMQRPVVFIIDGIDENQYFFQEKTVHNRSLELFCRSSTSQQILSSVMAQNFYLSLFYPDIDGVNIEDGIIRKDKFPVYRITWETKALINYADYVLDEMNKRASETTRCKVLPDFKTLVNYDNVQIRDIINRIETPRELHYFMSELIGEMNKSLNDIEEPFIATYDNVLNAFKKWQEFFNKYQNHNQ